MQSQRRAILSALQTLVRRAVEVCNPPCADEANGPNRTLKAIMTKVSFEPNL